MGTTTSGQIRMLVDINETTAASGARGAQAWKHLLDALVSLSLGAGSGNVIDKVCSTGGKAVPSRSLATTKADVYDFVHASGVNVIYDGGSAAYFLDEEGQPVVMTTAVGKLKGMFFKFNTPNGNAKVSIVGTLFGGASLPFLAAADGVNVGPGGWFGMFDPAGYTCTAGADTITVTNLGTVTVTYDVVFILSSS
jgi:hypothetical protein